MYQWDCFLCLQLPCLVRESAAASSVPGGSWTEDSVFLPPIALANNGKSKKHVCNDNSHSTFSVTLFSVWAELCSCSIELAREEGRSAVGGQRADGILETILAGIILLTILPVMSWAITKEHDQPVEGGDPDPLLL